MSVTTCGARCEGLWSPTTAATFFPCATGYAWKPPRSSWQPSRKSRAEPAGVNLWALPRSTGYVRFLAAGRPLRGAAASAQSAVCFDRGALARHRHRREHDDFHDRERAALQTSARRGRAGRLVDVGRSQDGQGFDNGSYPNYLDIRARNTVFSGIYAYRSAPSR